MTMTTSRGVRGVRWIAAAAGLIVAGGAGANAEFLPIGDLQGGAFFSEAFGISPDGAAVLGRSTIGVQADGTPLNLAVRWTEAEGLVIIGAVTPGKASLARAASNGGEVVTGISVTSGNNQAYRWTADTGIISLGGLNSPTNFSNAFDITPDGSTIVGVTNGFPDPITAFRWTADGGFEAIPGFTAVAVSADGEVVAGYFANPLSAYRWQAGSAFAVPLGSLGGDESEPTDMTPDGSIIVGFADALPSFDDPEGAPVVQQGFIWSAATGMQPIPLLPGANGARAGGVSADGGVVVGTTNLPHGDAAFIWDAQNGPRELRTALADEYGLELPGWRLITATGISDDGLAIVGTGLNPDGDVEGYLVRLPACEGDLDADGVVGSKDLNMVLSAFGRTDEGDVDGDGDTDSEDLNAVLRGFGCEPGGAS